jgi:sugar phosphate isomerase/epimerase
MRASFHSVGLFRDPVLVALRKAHAAGYAAFELNAETLPWAGPHVTPATSAAERAAIVAGAREMGMVIDAVGAHIPMIHADPKARKASIEFVNGCVALARDVGAPVVHILSGPLAPNIDRRDAWRWFADAVSAAAQTAVDHDVTLAIEAIVGHMFRGIDDYHALRRDLPGVPFRINFDPSHLVVHGEDPLRLVAELGGEIVHVHMKDGAGRYPAFSFPPLGAGEINFGALVEELRKQNYSGSLAVEYEANAFGYAEPEEEILRHGKRFLAAFGIDGR